MGSSREMNGEVQCWFFKMVVGGIRGRGRTAANWRQTHRKGAGKQVLETFRETESSGSIGIPVFAGFRESDAWWDSSFRSSAQPGSRP